MDNERPYPKIVYADGEPFERPALTVNYDLIIEECKKRWRFDPVSLEHATDILRQLQYEQQKKKY